MNYLTLPMITICCVMVVWRRIGCLLAPDSGSYLDVINGVHSLEQSKTVLATPHLGTSPSSLTFHHSQTTGEGPGKLNNNLEAYRQEIADGRNPAGGFSRLGEGADSQNVFTGTYDRSDSIEEMLSSFSIASIVRLAPDFYEKEVASPAGKVAQMFSEFIDVPGNALSSAESSHVETAQHFQKFEWGHDSNSYERLMQSTLNEDPRLKTDKLGQLFMESSGSPANAPSVSGDTPHQTSDQIEEFGRRRLSNFHESLAGDKIKCLPRSSLTSLSPGLRLVEDVPRVDLPRVEHQASRTAGRGSATIPDDFRMWQLKQHARLQANCIKNAINPSPSYEFPATAPIATDEARHYPSLIHSHRPEAVFFRRLREKGMKPRERNELERVKEPSGKRQSEEEASFKPSKSLKASSSSYEAVVLNDQSKKLVSIENFYNQQPELNYLPTEISARRSSIGSRLHHFLKLEQQEIKVIQKEGQNENSKFPWFVLLGCSRKQKEEAKQIQSYFISLLHGQTSQLNSFERLIEAYPGSEMFEKRPCSLLGWRVGQPSDQLLPAQYLYLPDQHQFSPELLWGRASSCQLSRVLPPGEVPHFETTYKHMSLRIDRFLGIRRSKELQLYKDADGLFHEFLKSPRSSQSNPGRKLKGSFYEWNFYAEITFTVFNKVILSYRLFTPFGPQEISEMKNALRILNRDSVALWFEFLLNSGESGDTVSETSENVFLRPKNMSRFEGIRKASICSNERWHRARNLIFWLWFENQKNPYLERVRTSVGIKKKNMDGYIRFVDYFHIPDWLESVPS